MALLQTKKFMSDPDRYYREVRSGTRVAADFTVAPGFNPLKVCVRNATDGASAEWHSDLPTPDALQLKTVAAGTRTMEDCGVTVLDGVISVAVATAGLETDNNVTIIEAWD